MKDNKTSWGKVAKWYESAVTSPDSYQMKVILPNLLRVLNLREKEAVLDLACGSGFFSREFTKLGAKVTGVDIGQELISIAKAHDKQSRYLIGNAEDLSGLKLQNFDAVVCVLAIQNIKNLQSAVGEMFKLLKPNGRAVLVLNHPAFRIPGKSFWEFSADKKTQYRKLESYMSEFFSEIDMHPGKNLPKNKKYTYSFHRPLQVYFKAFSKAGFLVSRLEEWVSHKESDKGVTKKAEDAARKEFPMFMCLELKK